MACTNLEGNWKKQNLPQWRLYVVVGCTRRPGSAQSPCRGDVGGCTSLPDRRTQVQETCRHMVRSLMEQCNNTFVKTDH